jgi:hypothetical protein
VYIIVSGFMLLFLAIAVLGAKIYVDTRDEAEVLPDGQPADDKLNQPEQEAVEPIEGKAMPTDSGNEDSDESNQQSEKTPKGDGLLGIFVFLIAVGGATLIFISSLEPSIPQIEGYGGNQNPFVGIANVGIGVLGIFEMILFLLAGGALLVISLIGFAIWRNFERIKAKILISVTRSANAIVGIRERTIAEKASIMILAGVIGLCFYLVSVSLKNF